MARIAALVIPHTQAIMGVCVSVVAVGSMYSHTLGLDSFRRIVAQYKDGEPQPLDEKTAKLAEEIVMSLPMSADEEVGIQFFTMYGQETCHRGSLKLRTGAIIGIPATFAYESTSQVKTEQIHINNVPVNWDSRGGEILLKSIVLSPKAKAFAIAREVHYANTYHVWVEAALKCFFTLGAYSLGFWASQFFRLRMIMKRWARGSLFGLIGTTAYILYVLLDDTYYCNRDQAIDKRTMTLGKEYAEGGVEFYTKLLQRNMALRLLLGSEGERLYTVYGNKVGTWRRPHAMLSERRDYLVNYLNELNKKEISNLETDTKASTESA